MGSVAITFDVDAAAGLGADLPAYADRLTSVSEREYGATRGVPRLLELLGEHEMRATFYVPGATALAHPEVVRDILAAGHEVGHHGHHHLRSHEIDAGAQTAEIDDGLAALAQLGVTPRGYRSPAWELTPHTLALLVERGFAWDSSLMGDDRPYWLDARGGRLLELPIHWSLDDVMWFDIGPATRPTAPSAWLEAWTDELTAAHAEGRPVTLTLHPEVIGRGYRALAFGRLLDHIADARFDVVTHAELAQTNS